MVRAPEFDAVAATLRLRSCEWEFLHAVDGRATVGELAERCGMDSEAATAFAWEAMQRGLVVFETITLEEFRARFGRMDLSAGTAGADAPTSLSADTFDWNAYDVLHVEHVAHEDAPPEMVSGDAHAEIDPAEAHAEATPAEVHAELVPAEAHAEAMAPEAHAEAMTPEAHAEVMTPEAHDEAMAEAHADVIAAEAHAEVMMPEVHAEVIPAEARAEVMALEAHDEIEPTAVHAEPVVAEARDEMAPAGSHSESFVTGDELVEARDEAYREAPVHVELGPESETEDSQTFLYDSDLAAADLETTYDDDDSAEPVAFDSPEPVAFDSPEPVAFDSPEPAALDAAEPVAFDSTEPTAFDSTEPVALDSTEDISFDDDAGGISLSFSGDEPWDQPAEITHEDEPERPPLPVASASVEPVAEPAAMSAVAHDGRSDDDDLASARSWRDSLSWREQEALREAKDAGGDRSTLLGSLLRTLGVH
jgi:hypothetical protein